MITNSNLLQRDPDEHVLLVIRRTSLGILPHVLVSFASIFGYLYLLFQVGSGALQFDKFSTGMTVFTFTAGLLLVLSVLYLMASVYRENVLILTSESIVQKNQITPFVNKVSQLGLGNIEDVTVAQTGFFATNFNFGTLSIETAGEQANFIFKYARNPRMASNEIIAAKEALESRDHRSSSA